MGIEYRGVLCVGYTYEEVSDLYEKCEDANGDYKYENIYEFCEGEGLESFSPYYDADKEDCIYGKGAVVGSCYSYKEISDPLELGSNIAYQIRDMQEEFTIEPKAYIMAHGW